MALKDPNAVIGETPMPNKYFQLSYMRYDYPKQINCGLLAYPDSVSAKSGKPVIDKVEMPLDPDYVYSEDEAAVIKQMLDDNATMRDIAACMAYIQIKKDERFSELTDA